MCMTKSGSVCNEFQLGNSIIQEGLLDLFERQRMQLTFVLPPTPGPVMVSICKLLNFKY